MEVVSTTVARLGSVRVGIGNIYRGSYRGSDAKPHEGLVIDLNPIPAAGEKETVLTVGEGATFELGGAKWEVLAVKTGSPRGSATLRKLP